MRFSRGVRHGRSFRPAWLPRNNGPSSPASSGNSLTISELRVSLGEASTRRPLPHPRSAPTTRRHLARQCGHAFHPIPPDRAQLVVERHVLERSEPVLHDAMSVVATPQIVFPEEFRVRQAREQDTFWLPAKDRRAIGRRFRGWRRSQSVQSDLFWPCFITHGKELLMLLASRSVNTSGGKRLGSRPRSSPIKTERAIPPRPCNFAPASPCIFDQLPSPAAKAWFVASSDQICIRALTSAQNDFESAL